MPKRARGSLAVLVLVILAIALVVVAPLSSLAAPSGGATRTVSATPSAGGLVAKATWNGVNILTANTSSSAFQISFNGAVTINYTWSSPVGAAAGYSINDARLQIFYFGFALATRDITRTVGESSGNLVMGNWSTGPLQYILEGTYLLIASLLDTNGTTAWSQSFWVDSSAPFYILAALPLVLILLAVFEVYALCCSGRHAKLPSSATGGVTPPSETMPATPPAEPPDPAVDAPPPPGGSA